MHSTAIVRSSNFLISHWTFDKLCPPGPPGISAIDDLDNVREIIQMLAKEELHNLNQQFCNNDPVTVVVESTSATVVTPVPNP